MGMSASQARLLAITARIHDVEYEAQSIQSAKIQLSTQQDEVYQNYLDALDATTLTVKNMDGNLVAATMSNLVGKDSIDSANTYVLRDSKDRVIVPDDIADLYKEYQTEGTSDDAYSFALYALGYEYSSEDIEQCEYSVAQEKAKENTTIQGYIDSMKSYAKDAGIEFGDNDNPDTVYARFENEADDDSTFEKYKTVYEQYKYKLYKSSAEDIYNKVTDNSASDFDQDEFDYYVEKYNQIKAADGEYVSFSEFNGVLGTSDPANDSDWLQNMIECGKITVDTYSVNNKTGEVTLSPTTIAADSYMNNTTTTSIDKTALAKAEAEYEHDLKQIDQKDKKYDLELSKLDTERNALNTELESVKKVISDNIERTFGIFS